MMDTHKQYWCWNSANLLHWSQYAAYVSYWGKVFHVFHVLDVEQVMQCYTEDTTVSARISDCLADISTWMKNHHLQLNLAKTELMVFPAKQVIHHNININTDSLSLVPSKT